MASDDLTKRLPDEEKITQPTIVTVLERIQALDERMQRYEERMERSEERMEKSEERAQRFEERMEKSEERAQRSEERMEKSEERAQRSEERMEKSEERAQRSEERSESRFDHLEDHITSEIAGLREEMNRNFRKLDTKIQLLNEDILNMRETQRDALHRIIDLENKAL